MWVEILTGVALFLIIEGMIPFVGPKRYRQIVAQMSELGDNSLRMVGFVTMLLGLLLLFVVRS